MIGRPPRSTLDRSSAASDVYKGQLSGIVLWLLVVAVAQMLIGRSADTSPAAPLAAAFALAAAALPALWAGDDRTRVGAVALFAVVWLLVAWRAGNGVSGWPAAVLLVVVLLLWAASVGGAWAVEVLSSEGRPENAKPAGCVDGGDGS